MSAASHPNVYNGTLLDEIIREQKLSRELVKKAASEILLIIKEGLVRDGVVRINHFGSFKLKRVAARKGRNPRTGEIITIPERNRVIFTPCKALREMIEPVHAKPVSAPAVTAEPAPLQKPETEVLRPEPVLKSAHLKTASQPGFAIDQSASDKTDGNKVDHNKSDNNKAALQASENRKKGGQEKLIYFGIAATIIALVAIRSMPQILETPAQSVAVPKLSNVAVVEPAVVEPAVVEHVVIEPAVSELEFKSVEVAPMSAAIMATSTKQPVVANGVPEQKAESVLTQIISSPAELENIELEVAAVKRKGYTLSSDNNTAKIKKATAETTPSASKVTPAEAVLTVTETPSPGQAQGATAFFFTGQPYRLLAGNSLWKLSERFYSEPFYWPHIFYSNSDTISNPDKLPQGYTLFIPALEGKPGNLTSHDKKNIAEGYFLVYSFYKESGHPDAFFALLEAKRYSAEVVAHNLHALTLSAVEHIMLGHQEESRGL